MPRRLRYCLSIAVCAFWAGCPPPSQAANLLTNGDFADGVNGWETLNNVFNTGETAVLSDQSSDRVVLFQTVAIDPAISIARIELDLLAGLSPSVPQGFLPDVAFGTLYFGSTPFGSDIDLGSFETSTPLFDLTEDMPAFAPGVSLGPSAKGGAWVHLFFDVPNPSASFVTVSFEMFNDNGVASDSSVAIDNVVIIPEPGTAALLLFTALTGTLVRRSRTVAL